MEIWEAQEELQPKQDAKGRVLESRLPPERLGRSETASPAKATRVFPGETP